MRHANWHERFHLAVDEAKGRPWQWGSHDCGFFAAYMVDAIVMGSNMTAQVNYKFRKLSQYSSEVDAQVMIERAGGLLTIISQFLGEPIPWGHAHMGDVVLVRDAHDIAVVGVCEGSQALVANPRGGVMPLPMGNCIHAWRVG